MSESSADATRDPSHILSAIHHQTDLIQRLRKQRDAGKFKSVGAAISLQKAENDRRKLQAELPALRIVS